MCPMAATAGNSIPSSGSGWPYRWPLSLFLLAWALRLVHLLTIRDTPFFSILILDPRLYDEWAGRIAAGELLGSAPFFQDPLYPYLLGGFYALAGSGYTAAVFVQGLLGALVAPMVYAGALPWFGKPSAVAGGLMAAVYLPSVFYEGMILKTWLAVVLVALLLLLLSRLNVHSARRGWLAAGVVLGLACLTRGNLILLLPVLILWVLFESRSGNAPGNARAAAAYLALGACLVLMLSTAHNRIVGDEWIVTTSNAGQNFYIGNNPMNDTGQYAHLPFVDPNPIHEERDFAREALRRTGTEMTPGQRSRYWFGQGMAWIGSDPSGWLRLTGRKLRNYWGAYEIPDNLDYYLYRETAPVLRLPVPGFGLVAPFALLGAAFCWRRRGWPRLLLVFIGVYSISVILFFVFSRFRMPMMPALFVLSGHGAVGLLQRGRRIVPALMLLLVALLAVNLPVRAVASSWSYKIADRLGLPTRLETSSPAHFNLGVAYAALARESDDAEMYLALAEAELRKALSEDQRFAQVHIELGKVLARQQRNAEAIDVYLAAAETEAGLYRVQHSLGLLYRRVGDLAAAETAFREALRIHPRHAVSATRLGEVLLARGREQAAAEAFRYALSIAPGDAAAARGLRGIER